MRRDANANAGTFNQSDLPVHFGLGGAAMVDKLHVVWPNGAERDFCDLAADRRIDLHIAGPGDFDGDDDVDPSDLSGFVDCMGGPDAAVAPPSPACLDACLSAFDSDGDLDVDLLNLAVFQREYTGP